MGLCRMSRDIFVQSLPADLQHVEDIPEDFVPVALPVTRAQIIDAVRSEASHANTGDSAWITIEEEGEYHIEVNLEAAEQLMSFAFHVRGGQKADELIGRILRRLGLRAIDTDSESGLFDIHENGQS
jgi:hypothetical protein